MGDNHGGAEQDDIFFRGWAGGIGSSERHVGAFFPFDYVEDFGLAVDGSLQETGGGEAGVIWRWVLQQSRTSEKIHRFPLDDLHLPGSEDMFLICII